MLPPDPHLLSPSEDTMPLPLPQRRHRKMLKDGTSEVWPQDAEDVFLDGLREYWHSPWANFSRGRSRWRNQYLVDYLAKKGIQRSKKQVASHIQVLRNMWKGHPQYNLVAGPEEMSDSSTTSDRLSPTRSSQSHTRSRSMHTPTPTSRHARRNSTATSTSSPPSTPTSHDSDLSDTSPSLYHPLQQLSPTLHPPIKSEFFDPSPSSLPPIPEIPPLVLPNRVSGLCLWADPADPTYIDVDDLPFVAAPAPAPSTSSHTHTHAHTSHTFPPSTDPASPFQLDQRKRVQQGGSVRASLRVKLAVPPSSNLSAHAHSGPLGGSAGGGSPDALQGQGFSGAVSFSRPLPASAKVVTRVHLDGVRTYQDVGALVSISSSADFAVADSSSLGGLGGVGGGGGGGQERHVALLPDSWLTRCKLLLAQRPRTLQQQQQQQQQLPTSPTSPTGAMGAGGPGTTLITQQVLVDGEPLFVVIYDLSSRTGNNGGVGGAGGGLSAPHDRMRASLVHWNKHVEGPAAPSPAPAPVPTAPYVPPPEPALVPLPLPLPLPMPLSYPHQHPHHTHQQHQQHQHQQQQQQMGLGYGMAVGMGGGGGLGRFGMTGSSANDYLYSTAATSTGLDPWSAAAAQPQHQHQHQHQQITSSCGLGMNMGVGGNGGNGGGNGGNNGLGLGLGVGVGGGGGGGGGWGA